jgi:hypothetical protein
MFLRDEKQIDPYALNDVYVLVNFRPVVTNNNWRMDCGVAAYDNRHGLPPFFPTRFGSRITFTAFGSNSRRLLPSTWTRRSVT